MNKAFILIAFCIFIFSHTFSQDTITYHISFPNAIHHEAEIAMRLEHVSADTLTIIMSTSSPGRYAEHNFAKNIYNLKAYNVDNSNIDIQRIASGVWRLSGIKNSINIKYTLYGNHPNGTYSGFDSEFAHLNMPGTLLWVKEMANNPVKVIFHLPKDSNWKIATQLHLLDSINNIYAAPDLQYLMDSPCIISNFHERHIEIEGEHTQLIKLAINSSASKEEIDNYSEMTSKVVKEQKEIFGAYPSFEDHTYTFLCSYGPAYRYAGMEHRNSTMLTSSLVLSGNLNRLIGLVSHEFFHAWNIERIRPASLEPFDFTQANVSGELWFGEGFTNYYGNLTLCRAGILPKDKYINALSRLINKSINAPGRKYGSPVQMSEMAIFTDHGAAIDEVNFGNTFYSYYTYGESVALALDLTLRTEFENISLDELMKAMWKTFGKDEIPYSNSDVENTLAEICNDVDFARDFFRSYIYDNQLPNFESLFDKLGYKLIKKNPGRPYFGFSKLKFKGDTASLISHPLEGSAVYEAGVSKGDLILSIDEQPVTSYPELNFIVGTRKVGDEIEIVYSHHGKKKSGIFKLKEDNQFVLIPKEKFSIKIKEEEKQLRADWLDSKVTLK